MWLKPSLTGLEAAPEGLMASTQGDSWCYACWAECNEEILGSFYPGSYNTTTAVIGYTVEPSCLFKTKARDRRLKLQVGACPGLSTTRFAVRVLDPHDQHFGRHTSLPLL